MAPCRRGAFAVITRLAEIDPDQTSTYRTDTSGGSDYWYKVTYYSSTAAVDATDLAVATAVRGASSLTTATWIPSVNGLASQII